MKFWGGSAEKEGHRPNFQVNVNGNKMKLCERCNLPKPVSAFYERDDRVGVYAWCIACMDVEGRLKETKHSKLQREKGYIR